MTAFDVIVCGGGPAGSTVATTLARRGRKVLVIEREKFPRFHVGESLLPWNLAILERLGVKSRVDAWGPQIKFGARFYHEGTDAIRVVRFRDSSDPGSPNAYQVKRAEFDDLLLRHSRDCGAEVLEETRALEAIFEGERAVGVRIRHKDGREEELRARAVVDATGRDAFLSKRMQNRNRDPLLERSAIWAHFDGFDRAPGPEAGDIVVVTTAFGWWWIIPFSDGTCSVGIVMPSDRLKAREGSYDEELDGAILRSPQVSKLLNGHRRLTPVQPIADYSYVSGDAIGDGWCMAGDANCFLDPVFSTGVLLAMRSGEMAANAIDRALTRKGRVDRADLVAYDRSAKRAVGRFRRFVHGFYTPAFLESFYTPEAPRFLVRAVTSLLAGNAFDPSLKTRFSLWCFDIAVALTAYRQRSEGPGVFKQGAGLLRDHRPEDSPLQ